jgi:SAM-dependent methyltransferase
MPSSTDSGGLSHPGRDVPLSSLLRGVWRGRTVYRRWVELIVAGAPLTGRVLDLGGGGSGLVRPGGGVRRVIVVDIRHQARPDVVADLEGPLPFADKSVDGVVCLNVVEHLRDERMMIREGARILKDGGLLVLVAPFLYPVHTARHPEFFVDDFRRYTERQWRDLLTHEGGFRAVTTSACGTGPFMAAANLLVTEIKFRPLKIGLVAACALLDRVHHYFDARRASIARRAWPVGYCIEARR